MTRLLNVLSLGLVVGILSSCGGGKAEATRALAATEVAYANISTEAASVAPERASEVESALAAARAALARGDHRAALAAAEELDGRVAELAAALPGLREQLEAQWKELGTSVPGAISALERKLTAFGQPPAGMPGRTQFDAATAGLNDARTRWTEAQALATTSLAKAVAMADEVRLDAVRLFTEFGQQGS